MNRLDAESSPFIMKSARPDNPQSEIDKVSARIESRAMARTTLQQNDEQDTTSLKAIEIWDKGLVDIIDDEISIVSSLNEKNHYKVNHRLGTCECPDHKNRGPYGKVCKHRIADNYTREAAGENMDNIARENTQGLIKKDLLLDW